MTHVQGKLTVTAGGKSYTLFVGMSVLADLQAKHGLDVLDRLDPPEGAGPTWVPDLSIVSDLFLGALQRYHAQDADRWLADDIIAENADVLPKLMGNSFPDVPEGAPGNGKRPKKAAA